MYELITEKEKCIIDDYRYDYARGNNEMCAIEHLLRFWKEAKSKYLFDIFGGNLILEKEIEIEVPQAEICNQMSQLFQHPWLKKFWKLSVDLNTIDLVKNKLQNDLEIYQDQQLIHTFEKGMKTMRVLAKINKMFNFDEPLTEKVSIFEDFRQKHSQILNQKKQKGTLCLSIHPLDYITMSMNDSGWQSCMRWDNGDYCAGTVEMMNSECVVVAYLKSQHDMDNGWNNKKWRELFVVDPNALIGVKGYPYCDTNLEKIVFDWLVELIQENGSLEWRTLEYTPMYRWDCDNYTNEVPGVQGGPLSYIELNSNFMYNDFYDTRSVCIEAHAANLVNYISISYSGVAECMWCGKQREFDEDAADVLVCCGFHYYCENCSDRIYYDDVYYGPDGTMFCYDCYCNEVGRCSACETEYYYDANNDVRCIGVYFASENQSYYSEYCTLCEDCANKIQHFVQINYRPYKGADWWNDGLAIDADKVPDEVFKEVLGISKDYVKQHNLLIVDSKICF